MNTDSPFRRLLNGPDDSLDLARAALLIAADDYPDLNVDGYLARLDQMAGEIRARLGPVPESGEVLEMVNRHLFQELGFAGNLENYYDPRNSLFNEVLDRRLGIPITLSLLYMEVGRRLSLPLEGVAFPGHFLVRLHLEDGDLVLDPFFGGMALSVADLEDRIAGLMRLPRRGLRLGLSDLLEAAGKREILARMLRNLKGIHVQRQDWQRALTASNHLLTVLPDSARDVLERALILEQLECGHAALDDYRRYLALVPDSPQRDQIRERIGALGHTRRRLN